MSITSLNNSFTDGVLQNVYTKQTQLTSEISSSEHTIPQQINGTYDVSDDAKCNAQDVHKGTFVLPSTESPAEVPINVPVLVKLSSALANEIIQFPDIDYEKTAEIRALLDASKLDSNTDELAADMMNFYLNGR
ncbi:hypothetical protein ACR9GP_23805 [Enterobacter ludwigii]